MSPTRVVQALSLLRLDLLVIEAIEALGDPLTCCGVSERDLRSWLKLLKEEQIAKIDELGILSTIRSRITEP